MILNTMKTDTNGVNPHEMINAMADVVKLYKQIYSESEKLFSKKEAHIVTTNIVYTMMRSANQHRYGNPSP